MIGEWNAAHGMSLVTGLFALLYLGFFTYTIAATNYNQTLPINLILIHSRDFIYRGHRLYSDAHPSPPKK